MLLAARLAGRRPCCVAITRHMTRQQQQPRHIATPAGSGEAADRPQVEHMSVNDLQALLANPILCEEVQFVDVREEGEFRVARLPHFKLLPLSQAGTWAGSIEKQLDPATETVVLCHHGVRSLQAAMFFVSKGFSNVKNVTGGIAAYSMIDASVPEY